MIRIQNVNKFFKNKNANSFQALKNISIQIKKNECVLLHGNSGSGKTTLLHIIASLMKPSDGLVEIDGQNIVSFSDYHASKYRYATIGYVTQSFYLLDALSVEENLLPSLVLGTFSPQQIEQKSIKALRLAKIQHKAKQKVATLSGGEKQRCIIARALVNDPQIILCDEPTANLDKENSLHFLELIKKLKALGKTIIIATHDPIFQNLASVDKILYMKDGSLE
jgi:putative ABC transport system ATP-binding protein